MTVGVHSKQMGTYCIETYGCQMNLADSELISGILEKKGWVRAQSVQDADLIVINTCTVRQRAAERAIGHVRSLGSLKAARPGLRIALVGCLAQHLGPDLRDRLPEVDLFAGPDAYRSLPALLERSGVDGKCALRRDRSETYDGLPVIRRKGANAWVSIMRGCDRACTYCAVPLARGRERSLPVESIRRDIEKVISEGFTAVTLLGQSVTSYRDGDRDFAWLIEHLGELGGLGKLRFLSPHPADFTPRLLEALRHCPVATRHIHLPLQSGSNRILDMMRRGYTREQYIELIEHARVTLPGVGITTDLMVGFPGETQEDFRQTIGVMETVRFDSAFMFAYSARERTYAARFLDDDVPAHEKRRRLEEVIALQESHSLQRFSACVGSTLEVLVEGPAKGSGGLLFGRGDDFKNTVFQPLPGRKLSVGQIVSVEITAATSHTLKGQQRQCP
ncbi:MAG: tRNA (N6-isopentenyl adenosine(37)-C2)-methylthiotransferase MiaB [Candidatus Eisenbacteria sp.]|nr:tRNA (N6-isopentenyl adenosine(37)-C2)-methylthiotransferase MiaB [Candidatus Eisenbacteria bacterium]